MMEAQCQPTIFDSSPAIGRVDSCFLSSRATSYQNGDRRTLVPCSQKLSQVKQLRQRMNTNGVTKNTVETAVTTSVATQYDPASMCDICQGSVRAYKWYHARSVTIQSFILARTAILLQIIIISCLSLGVRICVWFLSTSVSKRRRTESQHWWLMDGPREVRLADQCVSH